MRAIEHLTSAISKVAIGSAQFGLDYGVANTAGLVSVEDCRAILKKAHSVGIDTIDTARSYGTSEETLGSLGVQHWKVISKLPAIPAQANGAEEWIIAQVRCSLRKLRITQLDSLLLHRPADLLGCHCDGVVGALRRIKDEGLARSVGYSIYSPDELNALLDIYIPDIVQAPFNIIDRRIQTSGWMRKFADLGIRLHTRSALLQGLLTMPQERRPIFFDRWGPVWQSWSAACKVRGVGPLELALGYVLSHDTIEKIVIGVDNVSHLKQILDIVVAPFRGPFPDIQSSDPELIEPFRWVLN